MYTNIRCKIFDYVPNLKRKSVEFRSFIFEIGLTALRKSVTN